MPLAALATFAVTFLFIFGTYWTFVLRPEEVETRAVRKRLQVRRAALLAPIIRAESRLSSVVPLERLLARSESIINPLRTLIERSGLKVTVGVVVLGSIFAGIVGYGVINLTTHLWVGGVIGGLALAALPTLYVRRAAVKRMEVFEEQFPEAVDLMARSLRAGHALTSSLQLAGEEIPDPVGAEFRLLFDRQNFGMSLTDALKEFANRVPLLDARFFVTAVLIQRETGGNLSQVLDNLASVIRERFKVQRQVRVMSAHGRITGWVLGLLPPVMAVILFILDPEHITLLLADPIGIDMLSVAAVLQVIGIFAIRRIVDVKYLSMLPLLLAALGLFVLVALGVGVMTSSWLERNTPEQRRLRNLTQAGAGAALPQASGRLTSDDLDPRLARLSRLAAKSPQEMSRVQRRLVRAGFTNPAAAIYFSFTQMLLPLLLGGTVLAVFGTTKWMYALLALAVGYIAPGIYVSRRTAHRQKLIQNGLADALDLLTVCVEAGSGLDQAIARASDELEIAHPDVAGELRTITTETRAGKSRQEAFMNFAKRTGVDDVRSLVSMLTQTDRFGTSIGQALRAHAETIRTKRRQRAEERAAKVSVKLVFPLALCLFPALYVVCFGSVVIRIYRAFL